MKCCVKNCSNNQKNRREGMKFFSFPKDHEMRKKWIEACRNPKVATYKHGIICSEHFENTAYKLQVQLGFCGQRGTSQLQPTAVPTINLPEIVLEPLVDNNCSQGTKTQDGGAPLFGEVPNANIILVKEETFCSNPTTSQAIFLEEHQYKLLEENCPQVMKVEDGDVSLFLEIAGTDAAQAKEETFNSVLTSSEIILLEEHRHKPLEENCSQGVKAEDGDASFSCEIPSTEVAQVKEETFNSTFTASEVTSLEEHRLEYLEENDSQGMKAEDGDAFLTCEIPSISTVEVKRGAFGPFPTTSILEKNRMLEAHIVKLQEMNKKLIRQKRKDMEWFKRKITDIKMQEQISRSTAALRMQEEMEQVLGTIFTPGQVECLLHKKKKVKWSPEDVRSAISLRNVSLKAYRYLRNTMKYPLPGLSTLSMHRWASLTANSPVQCTKTVEDSEPLSET